MNNTELRADILLGMNSYILECIGDEFVTQRWLADGIPDGADVDEVREIAEDEREFERISYLFGNLVCDFR